MKLKQVAKNKTPFFLLEDGDSVVSGEVHNGLLIKYVLEVKEENQMDFECLFPYAYAGGMCLFPLKNGLCTPDASEALESFYGNGRVAIIDMSDEQTKTNFNLMEL